MHCEGLTARLSAQLCAPALIARWFEHNAGPERTSALTGTSQLWIYTDPAGAVSRGLFAPANLLIDAMRGAPPIFF